MIVIRNLRAMLAGVFLLAACPLAAQAAGAILLWPVDPVIEADGRAAALWMENRGPDPVLLQLRIFGWTQQDGENVYAPQTEVVGSPPMIELAPGARQLVRLTRMQPLKTAEERAYRVIVDEIPRSRDGDGSAAAGVRFQLRYSLPLFVYGEGIRPARAATRGRGEAVPQLVWRTVMHEGRAHVEVQNHGPVHARLTRAELQAGGVAVNMADGLLGYVLPGATMRWPLPQELQSPVSFIVAVNGATSAEPIPTVP